jgi:hypothetical protein
MSLLLSAVSVSTNAANIVDVFGTDPQKSADLIKNYGDQVGSASAEFIHGMEKLVKNSKDQAFFKPIYEKKVQLINKIKQQYAFSYVDFDTILYSGDKNIYTTIEVITPKDQDRLRFVTKNTKPYPPKATPDLIDKMVEFKTTWGKLMIAHQLDKLMTECPVYHCIPGFSHPELKDDFALFLASANKEKALIMETITKDPNPERRTAAIFLTGYFDDPKEIISCLLNSVNDPDNGVRNGAMRVIGLTMEKAKINEIDPIPFLTLLDSPYDTDRNKALLVLLQAVGTTKSNDVIAQNGKDRLISLLRLKQPNNQRLAHLVLKKISGKTFAADNIDAWEQWFSNKK